MPTIEQMLRDVAVSAITQSELERVCTFLPDHGGRITPEELRHALDRIGVETVPDPVPEPMGDVIVRDREGRLWRRTGPAGAQDPWRSETGMPPRLSLPRPWADVVAYGPLTVYEVRAEGTAS